MNQEYLGLFLVLGGVIWAEAVMTNSCWHEVGETCQVNGRVSVSYPLLPLGACGISPGVLTHCMKSTKPTVTRLLDIASLKLMEILQPELCSDS